MHYTFRLLRARLNDAVRHRRLTQNPMELVTLPRKRHKEMLTLTTEQARRFLDACDEDRFGALWCIMLLTALRPGEALGLKWQDLHDDRLEVRRSLVRTRRDGQPGWSFEDTKTDKPRNVNVPDIGLRILQAHKVQQNKERLAIGQLYQNHDLIFATYRGKPLNLNTEVPRHFKKVLRAAGLPDLRLYDLRHSAATLLLEGGVHPKVVQECLGHSRITLTLDTYSHVLPNMLKAAAEKLEWHARTTCACGEDNLGTQKRLSATAQALKAVKSIFMVAERRS